MPSGSSSSFDAELREPFRHDGEPVALLHAQLERAAHSVSPCAHAAAMKNTGSSSMASGTSDSGTLMPLQAARAHFDVGHGLGRGDAARGIGEAALRGSRRDANRSR